MISITKLKVLDNKNIQINFSDDTEKTINFAPFIGDDLLSKPLADPSYFRKVALYEHGRGFIGPMTMTFVLTFCGNIKQRIKTSLLNKDRLV